jgi:hypothetical protein
MDIFKIQNQLIKSSLLVGCAKMLEHNLLACESHNESIDIIELPGMNVKTTINAKLAWFTSLCVTDEHYIFGFWYGIAIYSK